MKKQLYTRIRYQGERLEPGIHEFDKDFISANPDLFKPESVSQEIEAKSNELESQVIELKTQVVELESKLKDANKTIDEQKIKLAANGGN